MGGTMKLFLVRHGESEGNAQKRYAYPDTPLTAKGVKQAIDCAKRLSIFEFDQVLTSPYRRARQTCECYTKNYAVEERLHEQHTELEGKFYAEHLMSVHREEEEKDPINFKLPGADSLKDVYDRALKLRNDLQKEGGTILCFSHACFMSMMISTVFRDPKTALSLIIQNAHYTILGENNGEWYLEVLNG